MCGERVGDLGKRVTLKEEMREKQGRGREKKREGGGEISEKFMECDFQ